MNLKNIPEEFDFTYAINIPEVRRTKEIISFITDQDLLFYDLGILAPRNSLINLNIEQGDFTR